MIIISIFVSEHVLLFKLPVGVLSVLAWDAGGIENKSNSLAFSIRFRSAFPAPSCKDFLWEIRQIPNEVTSILVSVVFVDTKGVLKSRGIRSPCICSRCYCGVNGRSNLSKCWCPQWGIDIDFELDFRINGEYRSSGTVKI